VQVVPAALGRRGGALGGIALLRQRLPGLDDLRGVRAPH
jgi:hypothetical protein